MSRSDTVTAVTTYLRMSGYLTQGDRPMCCYRRNWEWLMLSVHWVDSDSRLSQVPSTPQPNTSCHQLREVSHQSRWHLSEPTALSSILPVTSPAWPFCHSCPCLGQGSSAPCPVEFPEAGSSTRPPQSAPLSLVPKHTALGDRISHVCFIFILQEYNMLSQESGE